MACGAGHAAVTPPELLSHGAMADTPQVPSVAGRGPPLRPHGHRVVTDPWDPSVVRAVMDPPRPPQPRGDDKDPSNPFSRGEATATGPLS